MIAYRFLRPPQSLPPPDIFPLQRELKLKWLLLQFDPPPSTPPWPELYSNTRMESV